jgi:hypothetical protein
MAPEPWEQQVFGSHQDEFRGQRGLLLKLDKCTVRLSPFEVAERATFEKSGSGAMVATGG